MATYEQIQNWTKSNYDYEPKPCWIADVKAEFGLTTRQAWNRQSPTKRLHPCPPSKRPSIEAALRHFGMID